MKNNIHGLWNSDNKVSLPVFSHQPLSFEVQFCTGTLEEKHTLENPPPKNDCGTVWVLINLCETTERSSSSSECGHAHVTQPTSCDAPRLRCVAPTGAQHAAELLMLRGALRLIHSAGS